MKSVGIADLKARLSTYLRFVRRGETVVVLDRRTPIARIIPYRGQSRNLSIRKPAPGAPSPAEVPLPPPVHLEVDIVDLLLEDRESGR